MTPDPIPAKISTAAAAQGRGPTHRSRHAERSNGRRLTVVIPTHNGERWLATTLESLAAQSRRDFECILIDSSPTEGTIAVARRFSDRLSLRIERRTDIVDWQGKTNLGAALAGSSHLCMLHQDDVWEPRRAEIVGSWIEERPDVALHLHPSWIIDDRDRRLGLWRCPLPAGRSLPGDLIRERLIVQNFVAICAPVIRRDAFLSVGGLDRALWYTADWDLYLKLCHAGTVAYQTEALVGYRIHGRALTIGGSRDAEDFALQMRAVLQRHIGDVEAGRRSSIAARARAAIAVNIALADALHRGRGSLLAAALQVLALGPIGASALFRDTRLIERVLPRLRLYATGRLAPPPGECGGRKSTTASP